MLFTRTLSPKTAVFLLLLLGMAFWGNYINLPLFFGVDFLFGSIFSLLLLKLYGFKWGLIGSILASSLTLLLWGHPYAMFIFVAETIFVGVLYRQKISNLVLLVALFWLILGMPMIWVAYYYILDMNTTATLMIMLKDAVNGIFNSLIASLILTYLPNSKWSGLYTRKNARSFYDILFNIFIALIIIPILCVMIMVGRGELKKIDADIQKETERQSEVIVGDIGNWRNHHLEAVVQLSKLAAETGLSEPGTLQTVTAHITQIFPDFHNMYIADTAGTTLAFHPMQNQNGQSTLGLNFSDRDYFKETKRNLRPQISDVFTARGGVFEPIVNISAPIIVNGQFRGIADGSLNLHYIGDRITKLTANTEMQVTIVDHSNHVIASTRPDYSAIQTYNWKQGGDIYVLKDGFYHWFPTDEKNPMLRWKKSSYIKTETIKGYADWTIIVESPVAPYRDGLYISYIKILTILLLCGLIAIVTSIFISRSIIKPITRLADTTTDLPNKIVEKTEIHWPDSFMSEIAVLITNFRTMAEKLQKMFGEIRQHAYYDSLTGLPNRVLFHQELEAVLEQTGRSGRTSAILFIDLDRFKVINDTLGHANGDLLLINTAERLRCCLRGQDVLSRRGGDEFTAILPSLTREQTALAAQKILEVFTYPIQIGGYEVFITPSIGISMYPDDGTGLQELIKNADQAMYAAKDKGKNTYQFYTSGMDETSANKMALETMMHRALKNGEFELYYQPRKNILTGDFSGLEALIRWQHPEKGWISPADFVPLAEETGLINQIGEWVLRTACAQNKAWQNSGYPTFSISVNLSVRQFREQDLARLVPQILRETGLDPQYLELEITENISMHNVDYVLSILHEIKRLGVKLSMDDFGTGYSSLSYLKKFPLDHLKIDQSFIREIGEHAEDRAIVQAIIAMAHSLGMVVIAEGVETEGQSALLREMDCDEIQGYLLSHPLPPEQIETFLKSTEVWR